MQAAESLVSLYSHSSLPPCLFAPQMEESRGARLRRNLDALQGDLALAQGCREQLEQVARAAEQFIAEQHRRMARVRARAGNRA